VIRILYEDILEEAEVSLTEDDIASGRPVYLEITLPEESRSLIAEEQVTTQTPITEEGGGVFPLSLEALLAWILLIAVIVLAVVIATVIVVLEFLRRRS